MTSLYILTDASGFTTACADNREALFAEAGRRPLLSPIAIVHWLKVGGGRVEFRWKLATRWTWNGGLEVGA